MRRVPLDLLALASATVIAVMASLSDAPVLLRAPFGLALVLLLPGLSLLALSHPDPSTTTPPSRRSLPPGDRWALGAGLSVVASAAAGLTLVALPAGLTRLTFTWTLGGVILLLLGMATLVRTLERHEPTPARKPAGARGTLEWLSLGLAFAVAAAAVGVAGGRILEAPDARYSALVFAAPASLLCHPLVWQNGTLEHAPDGPDCPAEVDLTLGISNHEGRTVQYSIEVLWSVEPGQGEDQSDRLIDIQEVTLPAWEGDGVQRRVPVEILEPPMPGRNYLKIRLTEAGRGEALAQLQLRVESS